MTKLFKDPCSIINSDFYRHGDENLKKVSDLEKDTVAKVENGMFVFQGIPERFLSAKQEKCLQCTEEECPLIRLVQTRGQEKEKETQDQEETKEERKGSELSKLQIWNLGVKRKFQLGTGQSLIDQNYTCQVRLVLSKIEYMRATGKHFLLNQLFRFAGCLCILELAKIKEKNKGTMKELNICKEAIGLIFRSSQKHFNVKDSS